MSYYITPKLGSIEGSLQWNKIKGFADKDKSVEIISMDAKFARKVVFIPRTTLAPTAEDLPI